MTSLKHIITAVIDRIIPADDIYPSASQNGVLGYFDSQFNGDLACLRQWVEVGINALELESIHRFGKSFSDIDDTNKDLLLTDIEAGNTQTAWAISPSEFLNKLTGWTAEGYYSDPEHNHGNPNKISWKMIGFNERL